MSKCKICRAEYERKYLTQSTCGAAECNQELKRQKELKKARRAEYTERKEKLKTLSDYHKETQIECNRYIRERDKKDSCISCGRHHEGQWHAGHYRSIGAAPELRYNEDNIHKQCAPCNNHKSGNILEYRISLIRKIGVERLEYLEGYHEPAKWTIDELIALKAHYRAKLKGLQKV